MARALVDARLPITVVGKVPYDPRFLPLFMRLRAGVPTVMRGAPSAGIAMVRALRRGGMLGVPMDFATRAESVDSYFFDQPAKTACGPARLALRTGAAVVVGTAARGNDGLLCVTCTRIPTDDLATGDEVRLTRRIDEELSRRIRALPDSWPWMHPRFAVSSPR
jgi:KDO2-lipid IV(A) lauroyltransferase